MPPGDADGPAAGETSQLLTFLIADIRGYTTFTQQRGDEAAARLTAKFAAIVRELVTQFGGTVFELRGDEALCTFGSPRQSLRAAMALQQRFVEEVTSDPTLPLAVGIGVDAGEAVQSADGYRGGALNLAARLCSCAKAGEAVASYEVTHLARAIEGVRYVPGESVVLKGLAEPVRLVRVLPDGDDPAERIATLLRSGQPAASTSTRSWRTPTRPKIVLAVAAVLALGAGVTVALVAPSSGGGHRLARFDENTVGVIDPGSGHLVAEVGVDLSPTALVSGFDVLWSVNTGANTVSRIDPAQRRVTRTYDVGVAPSAIAVGLGAVWVANSGSGSVTRIDPTTSDSRTIDVGTSPGGVAIARGAVWVTNTGDGTVSRIDPAQGVVTRTIDVGDSPSAIVAGAAIWVTNSASDTVSEIDPSSASVTQTIHVGNDPRDVALVGDDLWVSNNLDGTIARIPAGGSSVTDSVTVGSAPTKLAEAGGRLWVALEGSASVAEVDLGTRQVVGTFRTGAVPSALVQADGRLWVATTIDLALHTGGTLKLLGQDLGGTLDPPYLFTAWATWLLSSSYDGLLGYRHANGAAGATLVPDLAQKIPEPTNAGRTYTFALRKGIRWSNGDQVTVRDVERGLLRTIAAGIYGPGAEIVGADGCTTKHCVVSGIQIEPAAGTITINLKRASSDFRDLLAGVVAVPANTPLVDQGTHPIPATGPYQVARATRTFVRLTRNPRFHVWNAAAQPAGFPDRIEYRTDRNGDDIKWAVGEVAAGRADWTDARGGAPLAMLQARFGSRLYVSPTETSHGIMLNTRAAPFNDVRVRRALAYAVDRHAVANDWFTPAVPTCQVIPPNFPGYRPYCPYTSTPDRPGFWQGTDFPTAQRLVNESHTAGMRVAVLTTSRTEFGMKHVVTVLRQLGYRAKLVLYTKEQPDYFSYLADSRHHFQAAFGGWVAGIPNDADLLRPEFACASFVPADPLNQNIDRFCDPAIDLLMAQAESAEGAGSSSAARLWAAVDARLVDAAPWIGLVTPSWVDAVSKRVHNYVRSAALGVFFDQMWVR
jgi:peptide/nickel transport system substrate-binding protein